MTGAAMGTPAYMSPEQAAGRIHHMGPHSDIYSLGATLYYLLTGQSPITGKNIREVLDKARNAEYPWPTAIQPDTPRPLASICVKAMSARPVDRYRSAGDMAEDIERHLADEPVLAHSEPWTTRARRWMRKHPKSVSSAAASLLVGLIIAIVARQNAVHRAEQLSRGIELIGEVFYVLDIPKAEKDALPVQVRLGKSLRQLADNLTNEDLGDPLDIAKMQDGLDHNSGQHPLKSVILASPAKVRVVFSHSAHIFHVLIATSKKLFRCLNVEGGQDTKRELATK